MRDKAATGSLSTNFTYRIEVEDVNDHTPLFDLENYDLSLSEDSPVNAQLFWLRATDGDRGGNGQIEYWIHEANRIDIGAGPTDVSATRTFGIFPDGHLYLKKALDREVIDYYLLTVTANDRGKASKALSIVNVQDNTVSPPHPVIIHRSMLLMMHPSLSIRSKMGSVTNLSSLRSFSLTA